MKTKLQRQDQDSELISLIDFVDSHPYTTDGSELLDIGIAIVQEVRSQVHELGLWPTLTPDKILVKSDSDGWRVKFTGFGTYSKGESEGESPHRAKCVRDIYRITYFLGTGEFPLQVEPLIGKSFNRRSFPQVPKRLLLLYKQFFVEDPNAGPRTLLDIQWAIEKRKRTKSFFGPVGLVCWSVIFSCLGVVAFLKYSSETGSGVVAQPRGVIDNRIELAPSIVEKIEFLGPTIAEIRNGIPKEKFPTPSEQWGKSPSSEMGVPIESDSLEKISNALEVPAASLKSLVKAPVTNSTLIEEIKHASFPESRVVVENSELTQGKLSLEWIRNGDAKEKEKALEWLQEGEREGKPESIYILAECYFYGVAVEQDEQKAMSLLADALNSGSGKAALMLGTIYSKGVGVDVDFHRARSLYQTAIEASCSNAYGNLGVLQLRGQGGEANAGDAVENFRRGANLGDSIAAFYLAKCLEKGIGGTVDKEEASKWYSIAASKGHPDAVELCMERNISISAVTTESL